MKTTPLNPLLRMVFSRTLLLRTRHFAMLALVAASTSLHAQSVTMRSQPLRITVPKNVAYSNFTTLTITTASLGTPLVNLAVTGIPGSGNANAWLSQTAITSNAANFTVTLIYTNDATIASGTYDMAVEATGDASFRLPIPVICNYIWSGASFTNGTSTNWATAGNWQGGIAPGASDDVAFREMGAVTNAANGATAQLTTPDIATNVIVSANTTVGSIRFAQNSVTNQAFHVEIQSGATLSVTGPNGFRIMRDDKLSGTAFGAKFSGGGKLLVSNPSAVIAHILDAQPGVGLWDMRALNNFEANVSRLALGDFREFPNYYTNGSSGQGTGVGNFASRFVPQIYLALTNVIKASYVDPDNYLNLGVRNYALTLGNNEAQGTTSVKRFMLGISNAFFLDSICFAQSGSGANPDLFVFNSSNSYALFRGTGGISSRMSVWVQGDPAGTNNSTSNVRGNTVDFQNGKVDALVDRLYLARYRTNTAGFTLQATLNIGGATPGSIFNVNDAILGFQEADNLGTGAAVISGPSATLSVNSNATFVVNHSLQLGYTTSGATGVPSYPENCAGSVNVTSNGTVMASNILAGGVSNKSINNNVRASGGRLIITNGVGTASAPINNLSITNGSVLTLHNVALGNTNIFVKTLTAPVNGPAVLVNVPVLTNTVWPITIGVISYASGTPSYAGLAAGQLPSGVVLQSIVDSGTGPGVITFTFTTNQPKVLVWRGNASSVWDTVATNWVTQVGGTPSRFTDGDSVVFDDTLSGSSSVTISGNVIPGQTAAANGIVVSNSANNYTFTGGSVLGGATVRKVGSAGLVINTTFNPGVNVAGGSLSGNGTVGSASLGTGTTMTGFSGTISGSLEASNANVSVTGTVNGGLALREGALTNTATGTIWGTANVGSSSNAYLLNLGNMNITVPWSIPTNSTLVNNGTITQNGPTGGNLGLTVNGNLRGVGRVTQLPGLNATNASSDIRVTIGAGGTLDIGNSPNEITNVTIAVRLDVNATSVTTIDVDNTGTPVNDKIVLTDSPLVGKVNFGVGNNLGGTLYINKIAGGAFNGATTIYPFDLTSNSPDNSQPAIPQIIPAPGGGLTWNTAIVISNLTLTVTDRPAMTNYVTTNPTNGTVSLVFSWLPSYRGWRLERQSQTNALNAGNVGLESPSTNWTTVFTGLGGTNSLYFPDITNAPSDFYFRSVQTISTTNDGVAFPAAFFRLTYP